MDGKYLVELGCQSRR